MDLRRGNCKKKRSARVECRKGFAEVTTGEEKGKAGQGAEINKVESRAAVEGKGKRGNVKKPIEGCTFQ